MSANYGLVRTSEKELTQRLLKFYRHVKKSWLSLITLISKHTKITNDIYKQFQANENKSNHMEADILNEAIWSISRNQPVANHLRFAISIIYSRILLISTFLYKTLTTVIIFSSSLIV